MNIPLSFIGIFCVNRVRIKDMKRKKDLLIFNRGFNFLD